MRDADDLLLQELRADDRGLVAFVRFTPGWSRARPVSCSADEEFVVLSGSLEFNGITIAPGSLLRVPAGATRRSISSEHGCVAIAWFHGVPHWRSETLSTSKPNLAPVPLGALPDGSTTYTGETKWTVHHSLSGETASAPCELIDLQTPAWTDLATGIPEPVSKHRHLRRTGRCS